MGDFNETLDDSEKFGVHRKPRSQMKDFQLSLEWSDLEDLRYFGPKYTWNNERSENDYIREVGWGVGESNMVGHVSKP